ncbi:hypothetical protein D3C85_1598530 [compost metagenome]
MEIPCDFMLLTASSSSEIISEYFFVIIAVMVFGCGFALKGGAWMVVRYCMLVGCRWL